MQRLYAENQQLGSSILELEAEVSQLREQAEALTGEYDAVRTEARLLAEQRQSQDEQLHELKSSLQQLEIENTQLKEQSPAMESVRDLEVEIRKLRLHLNFIEVRDSFLVHYAPPHRQESKQAIKGYLTDFLYQLYDKKYPLPGDALQRLDQVVKRWRIAKRRESLDRTATAFNNFIEALLELGPNNEQKD